MEKEFEKEVRKKLRRMLSPTIDPDGSVQDVDCDDIEELLDEAVKIMKEE